MRMTTAALACIALFACRSVKGTGDSTKIAQTGASADSTPPSSGGSTIALPVTVEPARDGDLVLSIITRGQVRSERESKLKSEVTGTVDRVFVGPGQAVRKGQVLVTLDSTPFVITMRLKKAEVDAAQIRYLDFWLPDSVATGRAPTEERR